MNEKLDKNTESFNFTYSSIYKDEVQKIREKYIQTQDTEIDELRKIDLHVTNTATFFSIFVGIAGVLVFGTGLSLVLSFNKMILGIIVSFVGLVIMGNGVIVNKIVLNKMKEKYGPRIIELSDKLLENSK